MERSSQQSTFADRATATIDALTQQNRQLVEQQRKDLAETVQRYEARIEGLIIDKGNLTSQLKRDSRQTAISRSIDISLDPFHNKVDQASQATVKSGVESLNDSLDTFTMTLLDEVEELTAHSSDSDPPTALQLHPDVKLLAALAEYSQVEEKRGFLLDAYLHHAVVAAVDALFFSGDVASRLADKGGVISALFDDLTKREPWSVVQRWRALTATAHSNRLPLTKAWRNSVDRATESFVNVFASAYSRPIETFEPILLKIRTRLESIFAEAHQLSIIARRDVLSVRMSISAAPECLDGRLLLFHPDRMDSVWADMGAEMGDEVISLYKFGLKRQSEQGDVSYLVKPEVGTAALLRWMANN
ncbi:hypothetical protein DFH06DRAFT_1005878 [Mycena polygramma]|nr:hypothetical protein DFH06DRAFT_1005878 [Mycena polygramma]